MLFPNIIESLLEKFGNYDRVLISTWTLNDIVNRMDGSRLSGLEKGDKLKAANLIMNELDKKALNNCTYVDWQIIDAEIFLCDTSSFLPETNTNVALYQSNVGASK